MVFKWQMGTAASIFFALRCWKLSNALN